MSWKFWEKKKEEPLPTTPDNGFPTDLYRHAILVGAMFARSTPPFNNWRDPAVVVPVALESTFRLTAQKFQVLTWVTLVYDRFGSMAAKLSLDVLCLQVVREKEGCDARQMANEFMELQNVAALANKSAMVKGNEKSVNASWTYFVAKEMFARLSDQLYKKRADGEFNGNETLLGQCIAHATDKASLVFGGLLRNVGYMPETFVEWIWSTHPGGHERHLQRRWNNPLFPVERQQVNAADVYHACIEDSRVIDALRNEAQDLFATWTNDSFGNCNDTGWCHEMLNKVNELIGIYYKIGGDPVVLQTLKTARNHVIEWWTQALVGDKERLKSLELAEQKWKEFSYLDNVFVQQAINRDYIPLADLGEAILSESPENIRAYCDYLVSINVEDPLPKLRNVALSLVREARYRCLGNVEPIPDWKDKLDALGASSMAAQE